MMRRLKDHIHHADRIVFVCGAGISTATGISDFKTLYKKDPKIRDALTRNRHSPRALSQFLLAFAGSRSSSTAVHDFMRSVEKRGKLLRCYTMNLDGMEQFDNMDRVRFVHGRIDDSGMCGRKKIEARQLLKIANSRDGIERFEEAEGCRVRPGFVMYGDEIRHADEMQTDLQRADLIMVLGSQMAVEPVAGLVRQHRRKVVCVNNEPVRGLKTHIGEVQTVCSGLMV